MLHRFAQMVEVVQHQLHCWKVAWNVRSRSGMRDVNDSPPQHLRRHAGCTSATDGDAPPRRPQPPLDNSRNSCRQPSKQPSVRCGSKRGTPSSSPEQHLRRHTRLRIVAVVRPHGVKLPSCATAATIESGLRSSIGQSHSKNYPSKKYD